jgi:RNA polymerase sigma-32 factor
MANMGAAAARCNAPVSPNRTWKDMNKITNTAPADALTHYLAEARKYPVLDAETEASLIQRWQKNRDSAAAEQIIGSHLRLVIKIARGFLGYGQPLGELVAEGNLGLMQALVRFDPMHGNRFSTYAIWWVRAQLQAFVMRSASLVRIGTTAAQKRLFFNLRRALAQHDAIGGGEIPAETLRVIADDLQVRESEVVEMSRRLISRDASLNEVVAGEGDAERIDFLADDGPNQEGLLVEADELERRREMMNAALDTLTERERRIVTARRLSEDPPTLEDLSHEYGVSRERVRQIEARALEKLGATLRHEAAA